MAERLILRSAHRRDTLALTLVQTETITRAVATDVEVHVDAFAGAVPSVWFQRSALDEFETALAQFERDRSGSVSICNLGVPDATNEFTLTLTARSRGHASLAVSLLRLRHEPSGLSPLELTVRFDLDGSDLPPFVRDWRALFAA